MSKITKTIRLDKKREVLSRAAPEVAGLFKLLETAVSEEEKLPAPGAFRLAACSLRQLFEAIASSRPLAEAYMAALRQGDSGKLNDLVGQFLIFGCRTRPILCDPNGQNCLGSITCCIIFGFRFCILIIRPVAQEIVPAGKTIGDGADPLEALRISACNLGLLFDKIATDKVFAKKFLQALHRGNSKEVTALLRVIEIGPCRVIVGKDRVEICCTFRGTQYCLIIFTGQTE